MKRLFLSMLLLVSLQSTVYAAELSREELHFVISFFNTIQPQSFAQKREYCGYIGLNEKQQWIATPARRGEEDSCTPDVPPQSLDIIASYHTHGAFSADADSELPSLDDMSADIKEEVDGFIATPGGRIWHIDSVAELAVILCPKNCLLMDPNYDETLLEPVEKSYSLEQLEALF